MNRVLSNFAGAVVLVTCAAAGPVPNQPPSVKTPVAKTAVKSKPGQVQSSTKRAKASKAEPKPYQVGMASWYGKQFHGRATASGEGFDMFELTAAHRQLPLGTQVKVTNLRNGKSIVVRVNDRGPYVGDRVIDLSYSAARLLSFRSGVEKVRLDLIHPDTVADARTY
jgi:peptidoglycan lytic transglycosylase